MTPEQFDELQNSEILPLSDSIETNYVTATDENTNTNTETCEQCGAQFHGKMAKAQLGRHKSAKHGITSVKESKATTKVDTGILPESLSYLKNSCLKPFGCKGLENVTQGMMDAPEDLGLLQSLLSANDNSKNIPYILQRYSSYLGKPVPTADGVVSKPDTGAKATYKQFMEDRAEQAYISLMESQAHSKNNNESSEVATLKSEINSLKEMMLKQQQQNEINALKEELKKTKDESDSNAGSLASMLKTYMGEQEHRWQMFMKDSEHAKQLQELKDELKNGIPKTSIGELRGLTQDIGMGIRALNKDIMEGSSHLDTMSLAKSLSERGFSPEQIVEIIAQQQHPRVPIPPGSSHAEWERLQRIVNTPPPQPQPQNPIQVDANLPIGTEPQVEKVRFNTGE